ncbi:CD83 antigen-like [Chiloscyllium plagiosum]|uniref:CD83 antigen-like n=1 Tax=Chiloscyllium plagiosum TaxID=36176 RepID=UPI001CB802AA|nr:CD83 antigen-like [Chiloscyllium plagiosum]
MAFHLKQYWFLAVQGLVFVATEPVLEVTVKCGETARLPCKAEYEVGVQYRALSWYKITDDGVGLTGIVQKDFRENIARKYLGFNRSVELASELPFSLVIHNISSEDFGTYQCSLWAPLGKRNREANIDLREVGILQTSKSFGRQSTILQVVLTTLGFTLLMLVVFLSIMCARNHKMAPNYMKFTAVQAKPMFCGKLLSA